MNLVAQPALVPTRFFPGPSSGAEARFTRRPQFPEAKASSVQRRRVLSNLLARSQTALRIQAQRVLEWALFDSRSVRAGIAVAGSVAALAAYCVGWRRAGFASMAKLHRAALSAQVDRIVESMTAKAASCAREGRPHPLTRVYSEHVHRVRPTDENSRWFQDPGRLLNGQLIVLKSPRPNERGVVVLRYLEAYRLFAKFFRVEEIARKYFIVLEPSWSGFCDPSILFYSTLGEPVFVCATEPRDQQFIAHIGRPLVVVPVASNTYVDDRVFYPIAGTGKDIDVVMIAGWAYYKRHWAFFAALRRLASQGRPLRVALAGYPRGLDRRDVERQAAHYGVSAQIEWYENLSPADINNLLNRSKVNLLWSRREGVNRTIIEGMLAGVPCVVRQGFNYGAHYSYVNDATGCFSSEANLPATLSRMVSDFSSYSPRPWVMANMSCRNSMAVLSGCIRGIALELGEDWTEDPVPKTSELDGMRYWFPEDAARFENDHLALLSMRRA